MTDIKILALDPASKNIGMAAGTYSISSGKLDIFAIDLSQQDMKKITGMSLTYSRIHHFSKHLEKIMANIKDADIILAETPSGFQNIGSALSYGYVVAMLAAILHQHQNLVPVTPNQVKKITQSHDVSKKGMIKWAMEKYPHLQWPLKTVKGVVSPIECKAEHMADAVAVMEAGIASNDFKQLIQSRGYTWKSN